MSLPRNSVILASLLLASCGNGEDPVDPSGAGTSQGTGSQSSNGGATATGPALPAWQQPLPDGEIRNVLLVTLDTTRADHLRCYGSPSSSTPRLDHLAQRGVRFEHAMSTAPITLPSHASIMTGQYPFRHGARNNGTHRLPDSAITMAEVLEESGYDTAAVISAMVLHTRYGVNQGFKHYDQELISGSWRPAYLARETRADDTVRRALRWLNQEREQPFFLWVHLFDPHHPYAPPPGYAERCGGNTYDGEIAFADEQLGILLDTLRQRGELQDTLVVVMGDHGESLGDHGEATHSVFVYDSTNRVPFIVSHPRLEQGHVVAPAVSGVDVMPTVLDLLGVHPPDGMQGLSLGPVLRGEASLPENRLVYAESMLPYYNLGWEAIRTIRSTYVRYVRSTTEELYANDVDPGETRNLVGNAVAQEQVETLRSELDNLLAEGENEALIGRFDQLSSAERAALVALGYMNAVAAPTETEGGEPIERRDPLEAIAAFEAQSEALERARAGDPEAEQFLLAAIESNPDDYNSKSALAELYISQQRYAEALPLRREVAALPAAGSAELLALAQVQHALQEDTWEASLAAAIAMDAADPAPYLLQGDWAAAAREFPQSNQFFQDALQVDPGNLLALIGLGRNYRLMNQYDQAREVLERAASINPDLYQLQFELGWISENQGRDAMAVSHFARAAQLSPESIPAWRRAGKIYARKGRKQEALFAFLKADTLGDKGLVTQASLGKLLFDLERDYQAAAECFDLALAFSERDAQMHLFRAVCLENLGKPAEAKLAFDRAVEIDANSVSALREARSDITAVVNKYMPLD